MGNRFWGDAEHLGVLLSLERDREFERGRAGLEAGNGNPKAKATFVRIIARMDTPYWVLGTVYLMDVIENTPPCHAFVALAKDAEIKSNRESSTRIHKL